MNSFIARFRKAIIDLKDHILTIIRIGYCGKYSYLHKPSRIIGGRNISLGKNTSVLSGARLEAINEYGHQSFNPKLSIGHNVSIGQNSHIIATDNVTIGNDVLISGNVYIGSCSHQYSDISKSIIVQPLTSNPVSIGDDSFIGYGAAIFPGVHLGKHCVVGALSVVRAGWYPDGTVIVGCPAKVIKKYNEETQAWERTNV